MAQTKNNVVFCGLVKALFSGADVFLVRVGGGRNTL